MYGSVAKVTIFVIRPAPIGMGTYEVVAEKPHNLYANQVDQPRLVHAHVDCLMKTVNLP